ncbi:hypothetical protein ACWER6_20755 [Streptomyces sp. NPDC004009]
MTEQNPEQPHPAELELARLRAGLTAGLTVEQSARIQGSTPEEMTADAVTLAVELGAGAAAPSAPRSGGPRGTEVAGHTAGSLAAGAEAYRRRMGLDAEGRRPERRPLPTDGRNPFQTASYEMER